MNNIVSIPNIGTNVNATYVRLASLFFDKLNLSSIQTKVFNVFNQIEGAKYTSSYVADKLGLTIRYIRKVLKSLVDLGLVFKYPGFKYGVDWSLLLTRILASFQDTVKTKQTGINNPKSPLQFTTKVIDLEERRMKPRMFKKRLDRINKSDAYIRREQAFNDHLKQRDNPQKVDFNNLDQYSMVGLEKALQRLWKAYFNYRDKERDKTKAKWWLETKIQPIKEHIAAKQLILDRKETIQGTTKQIKSKRTLKAYSQIDKMNREELLENKATLEQMVEGHKDQVLILDWLGYIDQRLGLN